MHRHRASTKIPLYRASLCAFAQGHDARALGLLRRSFRRLELIKSLTRVDDNLISRFKFQCTSIVICTSSMSPKPCDQNLLIQYYLIGSFLELTILNRSCKIDIGRQLCQVITRIATIEDVVAQRYCNSFILVTSRIARRYLCVTRSFRTPSGFRFC